MSNLPAFGIDLGTGNIKIYNNMDGTILREKNMIAVMKKDNLLAYGDDAYDMYEKAPANIRTSFPLNNGVIADIKDMQTEIENVKLKSMKYWNGMKNYTWADVQKYKWEEIRNGELNN